MEANRERTLVGLFVLIAGGLLFGTLLALSGGVGNLAVSHRIYFKFAGGVQPGAPVRFGGLTVGKVTRVRVDPANSTRIEIVIAVNKDAPLKTDSVAKITALGPLTDNYVEISTGSESAPPAQPGSILQSEEAFGLPQLSDAAQTMVPELQNALQKLNHNLDGLQVTIARANDSLLIVTVTSNDPRTEIENLNVLIRHRTDGLLIVPANSQSQMLRELLERRRSFRLRGIQRFRQRVCCATLKGQPQCVTNPLPIHCAVADQKRHIH